jgi:hypothetical protein
MARISGLCYADRALVVEAIVRAYMDDNGISEGLHDTLFEIAQKIGDADLLSFFHGVEATDGRFYTIEDDEILFAQFGIPQREAVFATS